MSLFLCEECGNVENTATSNYWLRGQYGHDSRALCSDCDPELNGHNLFERAPWEGQVVLNPEIIPRFHTFKCDPEKCSHLSLGKAARLHMGAVNVCKDCGMVAEIVDVGRKRREREHDHIYRDQDKEWKLLHSST